MKIQAVSENRWLYPDTPLEREQAGAALVSARNGCACLQVLTDAEPEDAAPLAFSWAAPEGVTLDLYQLLPVRVEANSARELLTTMDYASVSDFVTRQAPFLVYDAMERLEPGQALRGGRLALFVRVSVSEGVQAGAYPCSLSLDAGGSRAELALDLTVGNAVIPPLDRAAFGVVNWLSLPRLAEAHRVEAGSEDFWRIAERYVEQQLDMRSNHLMLPSGEPVRDGAGRVVDFDFSMAERLGDMALRAGFSYVYGGFVARFTNWREADHFLLWDREVDATSHEGYRQLKLYFTKLWALVQKNGWQSRYMQCLVDEPQFPNSLTYRALSGICRKCMPGVVIHDPVETTAIEGAVDIWCVKQQVFERHLDEYRALQAQGEEMWIYTCGYPAGKMMNRALDLPLAATRLVSWVCHRYDCKGFLHWGYNCYDLEAPFDKSCYPDGRGGLMPPGNGFIVYPGADGPLYGVRAHLQRLCAEDYELLAQLAQRDAKRADELSAALCHGFDDYVNDPDAIDAACKQLRLEA